MKHARVYTLGDTLNLPQLKSLASSKIHCVNSTAKGEIAYARYIYAHTQKDDTTIRAPVANFWATRSHTLRAEAEDEFRQMCLEFPQFGYDVLSKFILSLRVSVPNTNTLNSPCPGREAQTREAGEVAPSSRQLSQACSWPVNLCAYSNSTIAKGVRGALIFLTVQNLSSWLSVL